MPRAPRTHTLYDEEERRRRESGMPPTDAPGFAAAFATNRPPREVRDEAWAQRTGRVASGDRPTFRVATTQDWRRARQSERLGELAGPGRRDVRPAAPGSMFAKWGGAGQRDRRTAGLRGRARAEREAEIARQDAADRRAEEQDIFSREESEFRRGITERQQDRADTASDLAAQRERRQMTAEDRRERALEQRVEDQDRRYRLSERRQTHQESMAQRREDRMQMTAEQRVEQDRFRNQHLAETMRQRTERNERATTEAQRRAAAKQLRAGGSGEFLLSEGLWEGFLLQADGDMAKAHELARPMIEQTARTEARRALPAGTEEQIADYMQDHFGIAPEDQQEERRRDPRSGRIAVFRNGQFVRWEE